MLRLSRIDTTYNLPTFTDSHEYYITTTSYFIQVFLSKHMRDTPMVPLIVNKLEQHPSVTSGTTSALFIRS